MGIILNQKKRICRIANNGVLTELHCITGPVDRAKLTTSQIEKLVHNGRTLYEIDPSGKRPEVLLNINNCSVSPFATTETKKVEVAETKVEENPVAPVLEEPTKTVEEPQVKPDPVSYNKWDKKNKHNKNNYNKNNTNTVTEAVEEKTEEVPTEEVIVKEDL